MPYGGKEFKLPKEHEAGIRVPKGGSSCASCRFVSADGKNCNNVHWVRWNGGSTKLPYAADEYCSDWFEPNPKKMALRVTAKEVIRNG